MDDALTDVAEEAAAEEAAVEAPGLAAPAPGSPVPARWPPIVVVVGGVPGAGKTTAIAAVARSHPAVRRLDPELVRDRLSRVLGPVPYPLVRPLVHAAHHLAVTRALLAGPAAGSALLVHETATRAPVRVALSWLARRRGWQPVLVLVAASAHEARQGQVRRGRVVPRRSFARHWRRWTALRAELAADGPARGLGTWSEVRVVGRTDAVAHLSSLVRPDRVGAPGR